MVETTPGLVLKTHHWNFLKLKKKTIFGQWTLASKNTTFTFCFIRQLKAFYLMQPWSLCIVIVTRQTRPRHLIFIKYKHLRSLWWASGLYEIGGDAKVIDFQGSRSIKPNLIGMPSRLVVARIRICTTKFSSYSSCFKKAVLSAMTVIPLVAVEQLRFKKLMQTLIMS